VTIPFSFEGRRRKQQADEGLEALRNSVDTLLIINNDKLRMMYGNLRMGEAFSKADDILAVAAKGISEIITVTGYVNTDFRDVQTVMKDGGTAIMGSGTAEGENRAIDAVTKALASPLLNDNEIKGANYILLNITSGTEEITMDEIGDITDFIQDEAGLTADVIWGNCTDESLGEKVSVTVIATGFGANSTDSFKLGEKPEKVIMTLDADVPTSITTTLNDDVVGPTEVTSENEEPTLKTAVEEQPTLNFETETPIVEKPAAERVVFNLETEDEDVEAKTEEATWNWGANTTTEDEVEATINEEQITFVDNEVEEVKEDFVTESIEEEIIEEPIAEETKTVVWNLDDNSTEDDGVDAESIEEITFTKKQNSIDNSAEEGPVYTNRLPDEEQMKRSQERIMKIKELGMRMKTPSGINDLENEPAYKRRKINLDEVAHSSENPISRFTLSNDGEGKPKLNDDNSFLHDNVD
jgi:cell division protein FtsZ